MPNLDELEKISKITRPLEPKVAAAMRILFLLTEHHNENINHYIAAAMRSNITIPPNITKVLLPYNLVNENGEIPKQLKTAIRNAVKTNYLTVEPQNPEIKCEICGGPHATEDHNIWAEIPKEMPSEEIATELKKYASVLNALKIGGLNAAEKELNEMGLTMNKESCFCGATNHTSADHLRWLIDKEGELKS